MLMLQLPLPPRQSRLAHSSLRLPSVARQPALLELRFHALLLQPVELHPTRLRGLPLAVAQLVVLARALARPTRQRAARQSRSQQQMPTLQPLLLRQRSLSTPWPSLSQLVAQLLVLWA